MQGVGGYGGEFVGDYAAQIRYGESIDPVQFQKEIEQNLALLSTSPVESRVDGAFFDFLARDIEILKKRGGAPFQNEAAQLESFLAELRHPSDPKREAFIPPPVGKVYTPRQFEAYHS